MADGPPIRLADLTPAEEEGWWVLFELAEEDIDSWMLVGGQMMQLLAVERGSSDRVRPTEDIDVVVNVRLKQGGTEQLASWLLDRGFEFAGVNTDGVGHRFTRDAVGGPGRTVVDVLAPEGLGERTNIFTVRPARTVQAPGAQQAFERSEVVGVEVLGMSADLHASATSDVRTCSGRSSQRRQRRGSHSVTTPTVTGRTPPCSSTSFRIRSRRPQRAARRIATDCDFSRRWPTAPTSVGGISTTRPTGVEAAPLSSCSTLER